jgi:hypothetical protein
VLRLCGAAAVAEDQYLALTCKAVSHSTYRSQDRSAGVLRKPGAQIDAGHGPVIQFSACIVHGFRSLPALAGAAVEFDLNSVAQDL